MWYSRFRRYYLLAGPDRTLSGAYNAFLTEQEASKKKPAKALKGPQKPLKTKNPPAAWKNNAKKGKWKERAESFDRHEERADLDVFRAERLKFRQRQITTGRSLQSIGLAELKAIRLDDDRELPAHVVLRMVLEGLKTEQAGMGLPDYLIRIAQLTDDQIDEQLMDILEGTDLLNDIGVQELLEQMKSGGSDDERS